MSQSPDATDPTSRSLIFDLLRALALFLIVLAHSSPPDGLHNYRNFDVPLIVLISGAVFTLTRTHRPLSYGQYVRKRVMRLLLPTFVFLSVYLLIMKFVNPGRYDARAIARTYLLLDGIGFVWIIRVFLLVALIAPFLARAKAQLSSVMFYGSIAVAYVIHECGWFALTGGRAESANELLEFTVFYLLPYGGLFAVGLAWPTMTRRTALGIGITGLVVWLGITAVLAYLQEPIELSEYKYPPRLIYLWYAFGSSHLLFALVLGITHLPSGLAALAQFYSRHSLWVYLWHIPVLQVARKLFATVSPTFQYLMVWGFVILTSGVIVWIQQMAVSKILSRSTGEGVARSWTKMALLP